MRLSAKQKCFIKDELRKQHAIKVSQEGLVRDHEGEAEKIAKSFSCKSAKQRNAQRAQRTNYRAESHTQSSEELFCQERWKTMRACMCSVSERSVVFFTAECAKFSLEDFSTTSTTSTEEKRKKEKICLLIWLV